MPDFEVSTIPRLVPVRMLNEFVYCTRLFYLEWVNKQFAPNGDTVDGTYQHRFVDKSPTTATLFSNQNRQTSLALSSEKLGLTAVIDLVELVGNVAVPIDTKRGKAPDIPGRAWEPERVQLCAQGLLLREAGYECNEGALYFAESRERVAVLFDNDLVTITHRYIARLRLQAVSDVPPPPLVDSPKCTRCSLIGICLPDELNTLSERRKGPAARRVLPHNVNHRPVYVTTPGASVGIRGDQLTVSEKGSRTKTVRLLDVSQLCLYGNVQLSSQAIRRLFSQEIPTCWFSSGGWFQGMAEGLPAKHVQLRMRQVALSSQGGLTIARAMVEGKIKNGRTLLRRQFGRGKAEQETLDRLYRGAREAAAAESIAALLGIEGAAARSYFARLPAVLTSSKVDTSGFAFEKRNRRPPLDPVNCLLSFLYALLVKDLTATSFSIGFDPYIGFLHRPRFGRPALALDLAEEFRPLLGDSIAIQMINNGEIRQTHFQCYATGVSLTNVGRRLVLGAYERRLESETTHPQFGYRVSYRRILEVQTRLLAAYVLGETPKYVAFQTR